MPAGSLLIVNRTHYTAELLEAAGRLPEALQPPVKRWLDVFVERLPETLGNAAPAAASVVRLVASSEFAGQVLNRDVEGFFAPDHNTLTLPERDELAAETKALIAATSDRSVFMSRLRQLRNRTLLRILWADFIEGIPIEPSLHALSDLADLSIEASVSFAARQLETRFGQPVGEGGVMPMIVLAMGKLGGRELNFSSDVDLIFLYPGDGETNGARVVSAPEYFGRLAREVIALLGKVTADGFVYRVDTRLRPFGDSGPPVVSFAALESYLVEHGRGWERYAYVKARPVSASAESPAAMHLMSEIVRPFVYRRYLDYGVFESLRDLHELIVAEVRRQDRIDNLKLGPGGIREIEFIVQSLQLVRGGSAPALQTTSLRDAVTAAVRDGNMSEDDAGQLISSYDFLRRLENAVQGYRDQQTHDVPQTEDGLQRLAFAIGADSPKELLADLATTRSWVSDRFQEIGAGNAEPPDGDQQSFDNLWAAGAAVAVWEEALVNQGYLEASELAATISEFSERQSVRRIDETAGRRLKVFVARMLPAVRQARQPVAVLGRLIAIAESVLRRSAYLSLLNENPVVLERLVELCDTSVYLAEEIARHPVLLDELIDARIFVEPPLVEDVDSELSAALAQVAEDDVERRVEALAEFKRMMQFRVAVADFSGSMPIMKVSDRLTEIAERILAEALRLAEASVSEQFGHPTCVVDGVRRRAGLGIIAYGKLAGFELSYSSDLDLVFIHDSTGSEQLSDGDKPVDNAVYFSRVVRRLVHILTIQTGFGALYEIDTRLRPSGKSGLLVTSLEAFAQYQRESAWTWEHQALLRSRSVAGSEAVADAFADIRAQTLTTGVRRESLRDEVLNMRRKMRNELDRSSDTQFDLKQGRGGIGDIEFLVQYLVLLNADTVPAVIEYPDNIRQLDALADAGLMAEAVAQGLQQCYREYRARAHQLALDGRAALTDVESFVEQREQVVRAWDELLVAES